MPQPTFRRLSCEYRVRGMGSTSFSLHFRRTAWAGAEGRLRTSHAQRYGSNVNVPCKLVAPGPARLADALIAADAVSGRQNTVPSLIGAGTFRLIAPAAVPWVLISCTAWPARPHTPPVPQSAATEHPSPRFVPAVQRFGKMNARHPCGAAPAPGQSAFVKHAPPLFVPPKQIVVGNAPRWFTPCPGQKIPVADGVLALAPVVNGFNDTANVPTQVAQTPPLGQLDAVMHAPPEFVPP